MIVSAEGTRYSASDLVTWLGCQHASALDAQALADHDLQAWLRDQRSARAAALASGEELPEPTVVRGGEHEQSALTALLDAGLKVVQIARPGAGDLTAAVAATTLAMQSGADAVYQAALADGPWFGYADFLVRVDGTPSSFGDYAYEVRDTKLARHASSGALIQMAHYGAMLTALQGAIAPRLVVVLGSGEDFVWEYRDVAPYLRELRERFLAFHDALPATTPEPVEACGLCRWSMRCEEQWGPADLTHVQRLTRQNRTLLHAEQIATIGQLAEATADQRPARMTEGTFERLVAQAKTQSGTASYAVIKPQIEQLGLASTPKPHVLDLYFDLEGDPYAALPTLDYLWAYCDTAGTYAARWAHTAEQERQALRWLLDELHRREALGGDWHLFHYNSYEVTSLRRVAGSFAEPAERLAMAVAVEHFVATRFDDLYRRVEAGLRTKDGSTSLKVVEKLAGYDRSAVAAAVGRADDSIKAYEAFLRATDPDLRAGLLEGIRQYNEHDVLATKAAHLWLYTLGRGLADDDLIPDLASDYVPSDAVALRIARTEDLQERLANAVAAAPDGTLASGLTTAGAGLLVAMLGWHRSESVVAFLDYRRLTQWALGGDVAAHLREDSSGGGGELAGSGAAGSGLAGSGLAGSGAAQSTVGGVEHESCLLDLVPLSVGAPVSGRANEALVHTFGCRPGAWKIKAGSALVEALADGEERPALSVTVLDHDARNGTFSFKKQRVTTAIGPLVIGPFTEPPAVWESLMRLGEQALGAPPSGQGNVSLDLLDRRPPLPAEQMAAIAGESASDRALRLTRDLHCGVLPVQGPPGTGKTWLAARLVCQEMALAKAAGRSLVIGVIAGSHKVIDNLLAEVVVQTSAQGPLLVAHVGDPTQVDPARGITRIDGGSGKLRPWIDDQRAVGGPAIVGATKFGWSRPELAGSVDLLLIDEAGQLSLADALAVTQAADRIVALGDPQQLAAPVQAAQDPLVSVSLLEHLAGDRAVLPAEVGVFLDITHRMHPAVCDVVGALAYDDSLSSSAAAGQRQLSGENLLVAGRLLPLAPGLIWLPVDGGGEAEAAAVVELVTQLQANAFVLDEADAQPLPSSLGEILVVAPHNSQVNRIDASLASSGLGQVRVGTVDKFQGQQGHVVIYSMGRLAEEPGDVPFLYDLHRVNVALSRARLLVIVVAHRKAVFPPVSTPEQLRLASRFAAALHGNCAEPER